VLEAAPGAVALREVVAQVAERLAAARREGAVAEAEVSRPALELLAGLLGSPWSRSISTCSRKHKNSFVNG